MTELLAQAAVIVELSIGEYAPIRSAHKLEISGWIMEYLMTDKARITRFRNGFKKAIANNFDDAFYIGYADGGGGDRTEADADDNAWLAAKIQAEFGFIDMLFQNLKEFRSDPETGPEDYQAEAEKRAENYAKTLDGVYNQGKTRGDKNKMLTFGGEDGDESCATCQKYKGKRHSAKWWMKRDLLIYRGNNNYECGCYQCQHYHYDDKGNVYTI